MKFKELFTESREDAKKQYLSKSFDKKSIDKLTKNGKTYIQYNEPKSRKKVAGGTVIDVTNNGVIVEDPFGSDSVEISFDRITSADNVK